MTVTRKLAPSAVKSVLAAAALAAALGAVVTGGAGGPQREMAEAVPVCPQDTHWSAELSACLADTHW